MNEAQSPRPPQGNVREVVIYFFRLGLVGFGGPLALIGNMQRDLVERRGWIAPQKFAQAFAMIKAMPGPIGFMTAIFLGRHRAGWLGGVAAAFAYVLPAALLMVIFGTFYDSWRTIAAAQSFLLGMQAAALGVIASSALSLMLPYWRKPLFWILLMPTVFLTAKLPALEPLFIIGAGALAVTAYAPKRRPPSSGIALLSATPLLATPSLFDLGWNCFKAGAFVFGSGLAIVPMMEHDFVSQLKWLTHAEFMDALAFGQITPGPVVITATFIGFKALGWTGALVATVAIFAAPFVHMMTWFPYAFERMSRTKWISDFLVGAIAAVSGAILAAVYELGDDWIDRPVMYVLMALVFLATRFTKLPAWSLIPIGGIAAWVLRL
jgi:chromate transporter